MRQNGRILVSESEDIMSELKGYGICKECTAGTLNNEVHTVFEFDGDAVVCRVCGGSHIDGELYIQSDVHPGDEADEVEDTEDEYGDPYSDEAYENEVGA
jgi:hypothetical protein